MLKFYKPVPMGPSLLMSRLPFGAASLAALIADNRDDGYAEDQLPEPEPITLIGTDGNDLLSNDYNRSHPDL